MYNSLLKLLIEVEMTKIPFVVQRFSVRTAKKDRVQA